MSEKGKHNELLSAVFAEAAPKDLRSTLLGETLRHVQQRRQRKQLSRVMLLLVVLGTFAIFTRPYWSGPVTTMAIKPAVPRHLNYQLVNTRPLPVSAVILTQPLASAHIIASSATGNIVRTKRGNFRTLNDDELLALVSHRPAALIRLDGTSEYLIFANPADEDGFVIP
ncbi:MAG TPA: hypothetical protein VGO57_12275 [Verrucomicrobiae bacterium]|jgi:hypothetical protein